MISRIDPGLCTGCGTCTKSCPLDVFRLSTETKEVSPCMAACPAGPDIRGVHYLIQQGRLTEAAELFRQVHPFPAITGRVCFHPCEAECSRKEVDEAVNINALEQLIGDFDLTCLVRRPVQQHINKVAVVGAGPAGLSCAYFLACLGYPVTVYEAQPNPGGMLRYGIPAYRLPEAVVEAYVERLEHMGVKFCCNTRVGKNADISISDLKERGFKAVMLAPGTTTSRKLTLTGIELDGVQWGLEFLRAVRSGEAPPISGNVLVVGGGDVAMDAAISAKHLGATKVQLVCLEDREHMPAYKHNQDDAVAQGIEFQCGFGPTRILEKNGKLAGLALHKCTRVFDDDGRFNPVFDDSVERQIAADYIIFAIGQATELEGFMPEVAVERGLIKVEETSFASSHWGIFAAGDAVTGPASVVQAIASGRECAISIDRLLKGAEIIGERSQIRPLLPKDKIPGKDMEMLPRHERGPASATVPFGELRAGLELEEGFAEALRCMTCGSKSHITYTDDCMTCYNCELKCPSGAIYVHPFKERFYRTLEHVPVIEK